MSYANLYLAQSQTGDGSGDSAANAKAYTFFNSSSNWGGGSSQIGPDTIVHLCGTISVARNTTALTFQGSGTSGHPITLEWETGAKLTTPASPSKDAGGLVNLNGQDYLVVNGNDTSPSVECTDNGSPEGGYTYEDNSCAIYTSGSNQIEIKNLTINPLFVRTDYDDTTQEGGDAISIWGSDNVYIHHCTVYHAACCVNIYSGSGRTNTNVYNCTMAYFNWGVRLNGTYLSGDYSEYFYIHDNTFGDMSEWDSPGNAAGHHNGIVFWDTLRYIYLYNNRFNGPMGSSATSYIYCNGDIHYVYIFNNIFLGYETGSNPYLIGAGTAGDTNLFILNNYLHGISYSQYLILVTGINGVTIKNNVIRATGELWNNGCSNFTSDYNALVDEGIDYHAGWVEGAHSFETNAQVVNEVTYHPITDSLLIEAGVNLVSLGITELNSDKDSVERPGSSAWDIGAYQYGEEEEEITWRQAILMRF